MFYYDDYGYHKYLIPIGRVESGIDLLEAQTEDFMVAMELITNFDGDVTYYTRGPSFAVFYANSDKFNLDGLIRMGKITSDLSVFETLGESVEMLVEVAD